MSIPMDEWQNYSNDEQAALYISKGRTTNFEMATAIEESDRVHGTADEQYDAMVRSAIQRQLGFDCDVQFGKKAITVFDVSNGNKVRIRWTGDPTKSDEDAKRLTAAILKLKKRHDNAAS